MNKTIILHDTALKQISALKEMLGIPGISGVIWYAVEQTYKQELAKKKASKGR